MRLWYDEIWKIVDKPARFIETKEAPGSIFPDFIAFGTDKSSPDFQDVEAALSPSWGMG
jgi:hypothetical protein